MPTCEADQRQRRNKRPHRAVSTLPKQHCIRHASAVLHNVVTMSQAIEFGYSRRRVYRLVSNGTWLKLHEGVFLTTPDIGDYERWKADLKGVLVRYPDAVVSHRAAAALHTMEGVAERMVEATVPATIQRTPAFVHRTRHVDPTPTLIEGLHTTSVSRTLRDIAQFARRSS